MNKKNSLIILFYLVCFSFSILPYSPSVVMAETEKSNVMTNPYIQSYKESTQNKPMVQNTEFLVDPKVEEQIILNTLESYYEQDKRVLDILNIYYKDGITSEEVLSVNREDKIDVMNKIMLIFDSVKDIESKEQLLDFLDRYVLGPDDTNEDIQSFISENSENGEVFTTLAAFNNSGAANWAYNNWNSYSRNYPKFTGNFGTDCTNFVSQALHVGGGKPKSGNWSISRKNLNYWTINSASQLNNSWKLTDPSPWISVKEFRSYWGSRSNITTHSSASYTKNHKQIFSTNRLGNVIVFRKGVANFATVPTHLMIVSRTDSTNKDFLLAGHTTNRQKHPLLTAIKSYAQIEFLQIK